MDPNWSNVSPPAQLFLTTVGAELGKDLAVKAVSALLGATKRRIAKRFETPAREAALTNAMTAALAETVAALSDDPVLQAHLADLLGQWVAQEDAAEELAEVLDPTSDHVLEMDLLVTAFEELGFDPTSLDRSRTFGEIAGLFAGELARALDREETLQGEIQTRLLRGLYDQVAALLAGQAALHSTIEDAAERFHPLDLDDLDQRYLLGLYNDCNELPMAADAQVDLRLRPQLQRVYVDLDIDRAPDAALMRARLAALGIDGAQLTAAVQTLDRDTRASGAARRGAARQGAAMNPALEQELEQDQEIALLRSLQGDELAKIAKALHVEQDALISTGDAVSVLELLQRERQVVLLGDPGSGKSTLTRRTAGMLAALGCRQRPPDLAAQELAWGDALQTTLGGWLFPIRIVMSRWARHLAGSATGCADDLLDECMRVVKEVANLPDARQKERLVQRLAADNPTALLLLDGLDEVADVAARQTLLAAVNDFAGCYPDVRLVVTCRVRPYQDGRHYRLSLPDVTLAPLRPAEIARFLTRWHTELARVGIYQPAAAADHARQRLQNAIDDPHRSELAAMAGTPLLLTMMARVNFKSGLPNSRAKLYEEYVKQLLWEWERAKQDDRGDRATGLDLLLAAHNVTGPSLERALNHLAYEVHAQAGDTGAGDTVDIPAHRVEERLRAIHGGTPSQKAAWAVEALALIDDRSGLLYATEQGASYRFTHRTFQEYLAARHLASGDSGPIIKKVREKLDDDQWREAIFLALGYHISVRGEYDIPISVIKELLPETPADLGAWKQAVLLGQAYVRLLGPQRAGEAEQRQAAAHVAAAVPALLTRAMQTRDLPGELRLEAGLLAAEPALALTPPGLDDFLPLEGWFATADGAPFRMARYPVTNVQYARFMAAGGYSTERFWSTQGRQARNQDDWTEPRYWRTSRFNQPTQPVVGVSWYEAEAYCVWLTAELRGQGVITERDEARLPTQAEWEAAAHSSHGRNYPWGSDTFDPARANTKESNFGQTTPVHMYPDGVTPDGVWDLAGNVSEWTSDVDKDGWICLKGGAWAWEAAQAQASARYRNIPWSRPNSYGFRVVVVPISR